MIHRTQLITLHICDLLRLLGEPSSAGTMTIATGDETTEVDLDDLCMVLKLESEQLIDAHSPRILPLSHSSIGELCESGESGRVRP